MHRVPHGVPAQLDRNMFEIHRPGIKLREGEALLRSRPTESSRGRINGEGDVHREGASEGNRLEHVPPTSAADETRVLPVRRSWRRRRDRAAPRACERPWTTSARTPRAVAAAGPPARVVAVVERDRRGRGSAQRKESERQRGAALLARGPASRPQGSEGRAVSGWVGPAEDEASRARIRTGPFLSA